MMATLRKHLAWRPITALPNVEAVAACVRCQHSAPQPAPTADRKPWILTHWIVLALALLSWDGAAALAQETSDQRPGTSQPESTFDQCWRYSSGAWHALPGDVSLTTCVGELYSGGCAGPHDFYYGRWGSQTLRLTNGRVEISSNNRDFTPLVDPWHGCRASPIPQPNAAAGAAAFPNAGDEPIRSQPPVPSNQASPAPSTDQPNLQPTNGVEGASNDAPDLSPVNAIPAAPEQPAPASTSPTTDGGSSEVPWLVAALVAVGGLIWLVLRHLGKQRERARAKAIEDSFNRKVFDAVNKHQSALARRRLQLVQTDPYGNVKLEKWYADIEYFLSNNVKPNLAGEESALLVQNYASLLMTIDKYAEEQIVNHPSFQTFHDEMSPAEFESYCAEELRRVGWDARTTQLSRDQGVDVIAEKNGIRVAIQCKLYSGPVGNAAVQEIAAGKAHERADFGIVVTNNNYTQAAMQLATTNRVLLLHYRDLRNLESILDLSSSQGN